MPILCCVCAMIANYDGWDYRSIVYDPCAEGFIYQVAFDLNRAYGFKLHMTFCP